MHPQHGFGCILFLILFIWIGVYTASGEDAAWVTPTQRRTESQKASATQTLGTSLLQHRTEQSTRLEQEKKRKRHQEGEGEWEVLSYKEKKRKRHQEGEGEVLSYEEKKRKRHEVSKQKPRKVLSNLHTKRHKVKRTYAEEEDNDEDAKPSIIVALIYKLLTLSVAALAAVWYCKGGAWVTVQAQELASKLKARLGKLAEKKESDEKLADKQESEKKVVRIDRSELESMNVATLQKRAHDLGVHEDHITAALDLDTKAEQKTAMIDQIFQVIGEEKQEDGDTQDQPDDDDGASVSKDEAMDIDDPESSLEVNTVAQQHKMEDDDPSNTAEMASKNQQGQLDHEQEQGQQDEEPEQSMPVVMQKAPHVTEIVYQLTAPSANVSYVTFVMSDGSENRNSTKSATLGDPVHHPMDENDPIVAVSQFGYYRGYFGAAIEFTTLSGKTILAANKGFKERTCKIERAAQPGKMITNLGFEGNKLHSIEEVSIKEEPAEGSSQKSKAKKKAAKDAMKPQGKLHTAALHSQPYEEKAEVVDDDRAVSEAGSSASRKVTIEEREELKQLKAKQEKTKKLEEEQREAVAKMQSLAAEHADLREQEDAAEKAFKLLPFKERNKAAKNLGDGFANASWRARLAASQELLTINKKDKAGVKSKAAKSKKLEQPNAEATQKESVSPEKTATQKESVSPEKTHEDRSETGEASAREEDQKQDATSGNGGQKQDLPGEEESKDAAATPEEPPKTAATPGEPPKTPAKAQPEPQVNASKPQNNSVTQSHSLTRSDCDSESFIFDELDQESLDGALQDVRGEESPQ